MNIQKSLFFQNGDHNFTKPCFLYSVTNMGLKTTVKTTVKTVHFFNGVNGGGKMIQSENPRLYDSDFRSQF